MRRRTTAVLILVMIGCTSIALAKGGKSKKNRIHVQVSYAAFIPSEGETRRNFGKVWGSIGVGRFVPERPNNWAFDWDITVLEEEGVSEALLIPLTAGVHRGLGTNPDRQPYVAVRVGPYYGEVDDNTKGPDDTKIGFNANMSAGVIVKRKYFLEARYDWFSSIAGNSFNGFTFTGGVKVFDFSL
jgi:hypothetical protein